MDEKDAVLPVDREVFDIEENATVTIHQGNAIEEKRPGSAIYIHGSGSLSFSPVPSP
jgi:hypothetical protein